MHFAGNLCLQEEVHLALTINYLFLQIIISVHNIPNTSSWYSRWSFYVNSHHVFWKRLSVPHSKNYSNRKVISNVGTVLHYLFILMLFNGIGWSISLSTTSVILFNQQMQILCYIKLMLLSFMYVCPKYPVTKHNI